MKDQEFALTTIDNPYSPFTQWEEWYAYDLANGYNSCSLLDRLTISNSEHPDSLVDLDIEQAMKQIVDCDEAGKYKIITENDEISPVSINFGDKGGSR